MRITLRSNRIRSTFIQKRRENRFIKSSCCFLYILVSLATANRQIVQRSLLYHSWQRMRLNPQTLCRMRAWSVLILLSRREIIYYLLEKFLREPGNVRFRQIYLWISKHIMIVSIVNRSALYKAMEELNIPRKLISLNKN